MSFLEEAREENEDTLVSVGGEGVKAPSASQSFRVSGMVHRDIAQEVIAGALVWKLLSLGVC